MHTWLKTMLAVSALGGGAVWAEAHAHPRTQVARSQESGEVRVEVKSAQGFEPGDWVLVQPQDAGTSWLWELAQVRSAGEQRLELSRPLAGSRRAPDAQVELLRVPQEPEGRAVAWLDRPSQGDQVAGGTLSVEGQSQRGSQVLIFVDGVEAARLEVGDSGRFAAAIDKSLAPGDHQVQVVGGLEGAWSLNPEPVTVVSLAPPAEPVVAEPVNGLETNDTTPLFRGTAQPGTRVIVAIAGTDVGSTDVDASGSWSLSLSTALAEGTYSATVRAQNSGGETSGAVSVSFTVDVTPPNTFISSRPGDVTRATTAVFRFNPQGYPPEGAECQLDSGPFASCTSPYEVTGLADGVHTFRVRGIDAAGNVDPTPSVAAWTVDTTPPTMRVLNPPPEWSNQKDLLLNLEASEAPVRYSCTLDGVTQPQCALDPVVSLPDLSEGPHVFEIFVTDKVMLVSPTLTLRWNADFTRPAAPVLLQPSAGALLGSRTPAISGTAEPESRVMVIANGTRIGSANADASGNWSFTWTGTPDSGLPTGSYVLVLEAQDRAGNVSTASAPTSFEVDVDRPDTFIAEGPASVVRDESPSFRFRSTEEGVTYECSVDEQPFGTCDEFVNGSRAFEAGTYTLRVRARDRVGNVDETPDSRTWTFSTFVGGGGGLSGCAASGATPLLPLVPLLAFLKRRRSRTSQRAVAGRGGSLAALLVLLAGPARAQGVDLQQYKPAPGSRDVLGVYSPQVAPGVGLHAGLSISYGRNPLVLRSASTGDFAQSIVSGQVTADVLASISFLEHFELGLALPVTGQWGPESGNLGVFIPQNATGTGLGDLRLVPKAVLPLGALRLGLAAVVSLPTAGDQNFRGAGGVGVQPTLMVQWASSEQLRLLANVGGRFQPDRQVALLDLNVGNELTYALGAHWSPAADSKLFVQGSLEGAFALSNQGSSTPPLELLAAVGYSLPGGLAVRLGGGPGLTSGYGTPNFRLFASIDWSSQPVDPTPAPKQEEQAP